MVELRKDTNAVFNMALACLERINNILVQIEEASIFLTDYTVLCFYKRKLAKQLFLSAVPLLKAKQKAALKKLMGEMDNAFKMNKDERKGEKNLLVDPQGEFVIDFFIEKVQEALQEEGYFMPSKADPRYSWRES